MYEGHFQESTEVLGGLLEPGEDATIFLEPANESLDDVAVAICLAIELDRACLSIFVFLGGNYWIDSEIQQVFINPVCTVSFVACHRHGPGDWLAIAIHEAGVRAFQQRFQGG